MNEIKSFDGIASIYDAGNVDLVRPLRYHLDVDVALRERREEAPGDTHEVTHLLSNQ